MFKTSGKITILSFVLVIAFVATASANINIATKIHPKSGVSLNFDAVSFEGAVGESTSTVTYTDSGVPVIAPAMDIRYKDNYTINIRGTNLTDGTDSLNVERIKISVDGGASQSISAIDTAIDSGAGAGNNREVKSIEFDIDLSDSDNSYTDNTVLQDLEDTSDFTNTVTISYSGL